MAHFWRVLLYNVAFLVIALIIWLLISTALLILKNLTFNKLAFKEREVPLRYNQVRIRRFVGKVEIYWTLIPYIGFFCVFISMLQYSYLPFVALFFHTILFTTFTSFGNVGTLYTSKIVPFIGNCCLFLRPFELESLSLLDGSLNRVKIYRDVSGSICGYLSDNVSQVFSIGNPQGMIDNILHSISIYASDEDWKKNIAILAEKAQVIVVHVGETNGCIWEIEYCSKQCLFDKLIFIVDNPAKLTFLRKLGIFTELEDFSGVSLLVYRDLKKEKWCYRCVNDIKKADEEIEMIMQDYFSSRELRLKSFFDSSYDNASVISEQKENYSVTTKSQFEKPWIHRLSFLLCPFGYCYSNKWSESSMGPIILSFFPAYLFLFVVGVFGLGKISSIVAYSVLVIVLGYWTAICPQITSRENTDRTNAISAILKAEFLKRTVITFLVSFLIMALLCCLHGLGLSVFGL